MRGNQRDRTPADMGEDFDFDDEQEMRRRLPRFAALCLGDNAALCRTGSSEAAQRTSHRSPGNDHNRQGQRGGRRLAVQVTFCDGHEVFFVAPCGQIRMAANMSGSIGLHATRIAPGDGAVSLTCLAVQPRGTIGTHPTTGDQFRLVAGADGYAARSRWARAPTGPRARFTPPAPTPA
jgi:hypothetical protein